jgi:hypothetical protein
MGSGNILSMGKGAKERLLQVGNSEVLSILRRYAEENAMRIHEAGCFLLTGYPPTFQNSLSAS